MDFADFFYSMEIHTIVLKNKNPLHSYVHRLCNLNTTMDINLLSSKEAIKLIQTGDGCSKAAKQTT